MARRTPVSGNLLTEVFQPGRLHYWKSGFVRTFSDEAVEVLVDFFAANVPGFLAAIAIEHLGGAVSRVGPQATAFAHGDAQHSLLVLRMWQDPAGPTRTSIGLAGVTNPPSLFSKLARTSTTWPTRGKTRVRDAYGVNYQRLREMKTK